MKNNFMASRLNFVVGHILFGILSRIEYAPIMYWVFHGIRFLKAQNMNT